MNYAQIKSMDISNGEGIGIALFVQGCHFHCKNCFNIDTWDFAKGNNWTDEIEKKFLDLANREYIKRISILGGEPLADENLKDVYDLIMKIKKKFNDKIIWLYTGYTWESVFNSKKSNVLCDIRKKIILNCNIIVDGKYDENLKSLNLKFRGSANQRVIDVSKSKKLNKIVTIY